MESRGLVLPFRHVFVPADDVLVMVLGEGKSVGPLGWMDTWENSKPHPLIFQSFSPLSVAQVGAPDSGVRPGVRFVLQRKQRSHLLGKMGKILRRQWN